MRKILVPSLALTVFACAHHRDVRPGVDGVHRVSISTDDKDDGAREAIEQANHYCKEQGKSAAFIEENQNYQGDMDESDYKKAKTAAKVAQAAGGTVWVMGGKRESNVGGIVGMGGAIANQALGKGYAVEMKFKCQ